MSRAFASTKTLGIKRGRVYSIPGCGDISAARYITPTHIRLYLMCIHLLTGHTASVTADKRAVLMTETTVCYPE